MGDSVEKKLMAGERIRLPRFFWWVVGFDGTHNFDMYGGAMATWRENV
jgi:hypothetical protein